MSHPYAMFCDDFYVNMRLASQMAMPQSRETVLHFFDMLQRGFPTMTRFRRADNGEVNLEEDRTSNAYRWTSLESKRVAAGHVNPESVEDATRLHTRILECVPHHLGISPLEIEYLDVQFGFDLEYAGNHDDIVADTLYADSPLACLLETGGARAVDCQPSMTVALSDDCRLQGRIDLVTRTSSYQVRTGQFGHEMISVYVIVRRYWGDRPRQPLEQIFGELVQHAEQICEERVLPRLLQPMHAAISSRS